MPEFLVSMREQGPDLVRWRTFACRIPCPRIAVALQLSRSLVVVAAVVLLVVAIDLVFLQDLMLQRSNLFLDRRVSYRPSEISSSCLSACRVSRMLVPWLCETLRALFARCRHPCASRICMCLAPWCSCSKDVVGKRSLVHLALLTHGEHICYCRGKTYGNMKMI